MLNTNHSDKLSALGAAFALAGAATLIQGRSNRDSRISNESRLRWSLACMAYDRDTAPRHWRTDTELPALAPAASSLIAAMRTILRDMRLLACDDDGYPAWNF